MTTRWDVTKAVRASDLPSPARLILLVLADVAEVGTAEIPEKFTPSLSVLAHETGLARSTVQTHLTRLEEAGWITRTRPETPQAMWRGDRTRYRLSIPGGVPADGTGVALEPVQGIPVNGIGVYREPDGGIPGAGPLETDLPDQDLISSDPSLPRNGAVAKRGTRLPEDFTATPDMIEWARQNTPLVGAKDTAAFVDYWSAIPGVRGVKLDWLATWRNWMRRAQTDAESKRPRASPNGRKADVLNDPGVRAAYEELFPARKDGAA